MKKSLVFALLAAMTLSVTACGSTSSAENTSRTEKSESTDSKKNNETSTEKTTDKTEDNKATATPEPTKEVEGLNPGSDELIPGSEQPSTSPAPTATPEPTATPVADKKAGYEELSSYEELDARVISIIRNYDSKIEDQQDYLFYVDGAFVTVVPTGRKVAFKDENDKLLSTIDYNTNYYNADRDLGKKVESFEKMGYKYHLYDRIIKDKNGEVVHTDHNASVEVLEKGAEVPETVTRDGVTYNVIQLSHINGEGEFVVPSFIKYLVGTGNMHEVFFESTYSKVVIPDTVEYAELYRMFEMAANLESVEIAESVYKPYILRGERIDRMLMASGIKSYTIPDGIEKAEEMIAMCADLESLTIPDSVTNISVYGCPNLTEINYSDNLDLSCIKGFNRLGISEFKFTSATTAFRFSELVQLPNLKYLVIPDTVKMSTYLDPQPHLDGLKLLKLPNTRIENVSLEEFGYPALEILILPDEVDNIKYLPEHDGLTVYAPADVCSYYASKYPKINFVVKGSEAETEQIVNDYINSLK